MENLTKEELELLKEKANKYDELKTEIGYYYGVSDLLDHESDLREIGEAVATHFGYL